MADTIVNTPPPASNDGGSAGWIVALIILIAVIIGGFVWYRYYRAPQTTAPSNTTVNVTLPAPTAGGSANTGGAN